MPASWLIALRHRAMQLDAQLVLALIEQLPNKQIVLASTLTNRVNTVRFDRIIELTSGEITKP